MIPSDFTRRVQENPQIAVDLYEALVQITDVYAEMRKALATQYAHDGWSEQTMTIDQARAALAAAAKPTCEPHACELAREIAERNGEPVLEVHAK